MRWFLRGVIAGEAAADPTAAAKVEDLFRSIVVVRGNADAAARSDPAADAGAPSSGRSGRVTDEQRDPARRGRRDAATRGSRRPGCGGEFDRSVAAAAERSGLGRIARDETLTPADLVGALGGVRGLAEAILPAWSSSSSTFTRELGLALMASLGSRSCSRSRAWRRGASRRRRSPDSSASRHPPQLALWTGRAEDNYVLGFYTNAAYAIGLLVSLLVRWPLVGLIVGSSWATAPPGGIAGAPTARCSS